MPKTPIRSQKQPVVMQVIPSLGAGGAEQGCIDMAGEITKALKGHTAKPAEE